MWDLKSMHKRAFIYCVLLLAAILGSATSAIAGTILADFHFSIGKSTVNRELDSNSRALEQISLAMNGAFSEVTLTSYSSIDGKMSRNQELATKRAQSVKELLISEHPANTYTYNIINKGEDWQGVSDFVSTVSLPWKDEALEILALEDKARAKELLQELWVGEAWDYLMKYCFPTLRRVCVSVQSKEENAPAAALNINFSASSSALQLSAGEKAALQALFSAPKLKLTAYASPEGTDAINERLSLKRAEALKARILQMGYKGEVEIVYGGVDWDGLRSQVQQSTYLPQREAVLETIDSSTSMDNLSRKKLLQAVGYGRPWLHLMEFEMKPLRRVVVETI